MTNYNMEFPPRWQDFAEVYSFVDVEKIYTNGSILMPIFRVKQMIEHYFVNVLGKHDYCPLFVASRRVCNDISDNDDKFVCSNCGTLLLIWDNGEYSLYVDGAGDYPNYCPNCGAKVV